MKEYQKPEIEMISLVSVEAVSSDPTTDLLDGEMGLESSIF